MTAHPPKQDAERLLQLSNEVSRIAGTLAQLSTQPSFSGGTPRSATELNVNNVSADNVMNVIRSRRLRAQFFPEGLFADPAWDMMLDLFHAELMQHRVSISNLCAAAAVPATTALRWLTNMVDKQLFVRRADPQDGRRVFVELAPAVSAAMKRYFAERAEISVF